MLRKVISGGQTGVDRSELDATGNAGFPIGRYCPKGRLAEDGAIPEKYQGGIYAEAFAYLERVFALIRDAA